ncbi:MAG: zinc-binding alcohol dehydrogenase family protein [Opitutales bacterium]|jgi:zinc-binding alcohol dehydrogenase family protein|nr:zinc-binding alcohol dehydrogenase family protein [Opitutales bacterium]MDP4643053.1 zinc-binding alcohol dehydrogenase family protein [Opitutales bacterium]MDP5080440.1 zinc-binding alcohol dehydrogenase family protein [Opitutales bacterium]
MKAVGYQNSLPITKSNSLIDIELPQPVATGRDILVKVEAISVNPVDTKVRMRAKAEDGDYKVLGWDASGTVEAVGDEVEFFEPGQRVWYAGALDRPGTNAEYHLVDERIVGAMPERTSFPAAAAMPLTTITAWEMLFDRLSLNTNSTGTLLVIGGAGGVGSMLIQLAKQLTKLTVIATASREATIDWVHSLGADHVINHRESMPAQLKALGIESVDHIASTTHSDMHLPAIIEIIAPQGSLCLIDDPESFDITPFKVKSVSIHWELMFTRSLFKTKDMIKQRDLLNKVATMVDEGKLETTIAETFGSINADNLKRAHALLESGKSMGKIVLAGFEEA